MLPRKGAAMFAPNVAKPQTRAAEKPVRKPAPQSSVRVARSFGGAGEHAHMLQRTIGNRATLRYLRQRLSKLPKKAHDQHRPLEAGTVTAGATPGVSDGHVPLQRTIGDGHDLSSPRFAGDLRLEACFDDEARLKQGDTGESVTKVQGALIELGYDLGPTGADGIYGPKTWNAVKAFKKTERLGWEHMGDVGPGTMGRLNELFPGGGNGHLPPCPRGTVLGGDQGDFHRTRASPPQCHL